MTKSINIEVGADISKFKNSMKDVESIASITAHLIADSFEERFGSSFKSMSEQVNKSLLSDVQLFQQSVKQSLEESREMAKSIRDLMPIDTIEKLNTEALEFYKLLESYTSKEYDAVEELSKEQKEIAKVKLEAKRAELAIEREIQEARWREQGINEEDLNELIWNRETAIAEKYEDEDDPDKKKASKFEKYKDKARRGLQDYAKSAIDSSQEIDALIDSSLKTTGDNMKEFFVTGRADWGKFADDVIKEIGRIILAKYILGPLADGVDGWIGSWGKGKTTGGGSTPSANLGGRSVSASSLQTYHTGGIVGLGRNEVPIVAEVGEMILTRKQQQALGTQMSKSNTQVNVQVVNNSSSKVDVSETVDNKGNVNMHIMIDEAVSKALSTRGSKSRQALYQPEYVRR